MTDKPSPTRNVVLLLLGIAALAVLIMVATLCQPRKSPPGVKPILSSIASAVVLAAPSASASGAPPPWPTSKPWVDLVDGDWGIGGNVRVELRSRAAYLASGKGPWLHQPYPWMIGILPYQDDEGEVCGFFPELREGKWRVAQCYTGDSRHPMSAKRLELNLSSEGRLEVNVDNMWLNELDRVGE